MNQYVMSCYKFGTFLVTNYSGFVTRPFWLFHFDFCYKLFSLQKNVTKGLSQI